MLFPSRKTPRNIVSDTRRIGHNLKFKELPFCEDLKTMKLVLDKFRESIFAANQVENLSNSLFNILINEQGHCGR